MENLSQNAQLAEQLSREGVSQYLEKQQQKGLLRFLTCGSVDDGKSTLIGRLLHDSAQIYEDQLASLKSDSAKMGTTGEEIDLALLVDGLQAEREQGITIDVAYRYFSSNKRKFIIADTPGHEQYTRNMATGASTCDLAVLLVDARYGVQTQTRRHLFIASLLGIRHFVVAINKMDLMDYQASVFEQIQHDFKLLLQELPFGNGLDIHYVPMSALKGDNVVGSSEKMPWYQGSTLLDLLETIDTQRQLTQLPLRFPVQYVIRPDLNFRGFAGTITAGSISVGQPITALPSGKSSTVASIVSFDGNKQQAEAGEAITVTLADEIDISRGDLIAGSTAVPQQVNQLTADLVWLNEESMKSDKLYDLKICGKKTQAKVSTIEYLVDVNSYQQITEKSSQTLGLNAIARIQLELTENISVDAYADSKETGAAVLIDRLTNATVAAVMVVNGSKSSTSKQQFSAQELALNAFIREQYPHWQAIDITKLKE